MKRSPTDAELAILQVLWSQGPATVRAVHEALGAAAGTAYTTTLKLLQIMHDKGLVERDTSERSHVFRAAGTEADTLQTLVSELAQKAFGGSAAQLALRALSMKRSSPEEIAQIRKLLDERDPGNKRGASR